MSIQNFFKRNRLNEEIAIAAGESNLTKHEETNVAKELKNNLEKKVTKRKGYGKYDESQRAEIGKQTKKTVFDQRQRCLTLASLL